MAHRPRAVPDMTGQVFGRWTVLGRVLHPVDPVPKRRSYWLCRCACGAERKVAGGSLRSGRSRQCVTCALAALPCGSWDARMREDNEALRPMYQEVAKRLLMLRLMRGLKQIEIARVVGTTDQAIYQLETGKRKRVYMHTLVRYCRALDVHPRELLSGIEEFSLVVGKETKE